MAPVPARSPADRRDRCLVCQTAYGRGHILGGFGVGYVSTLANGCPLRQHVLAAQGVLSSIAYLAGFFAGAVIFHVWIAAAVVRLLP
jgi:uncharacterized membrane protein YedE/YeeE